MERKLARSLVVFVSVVLMSGAVRGAVISNLLKNTSFETGTGTVSSNWSAFGNAYRGNSVARSGSYSTKVYGQFSGSWNYNGVYQDVATVPGQVWEGGVWLMNWSSDAMAGSNSACARIDFYDASGHSIWAVSSYDKLTASTPANTWIKSTVRAIAPRQAVTARFVCLFSQAPDNAAGSAFFDDCEFGLSTVTNSLRFTGLDWTVCEGEGYPGYPFPNYYSTNSAYVDSNGWLHLRLTAMSNNWYSSQVLTRDTFGYGEYTWKLRGRPDQLNSNLVLGLFTYEPTMNGVWNEIDFEITRAFEGMSESNLQYAIQPAWQVEGNSLRAIMSLSTNGSTHKFLWAPGDTRFISYRGLGDAPESTNDVMFQWVYSGTNQPAHSNEVVFMNLYLWMTNAPANTQDLEVIVSDFTFTPFNGVLFSDNFDDSARSNAWSLNGFEGGGTPVIAETNGLLSVAPKGDWLTAGYITAAPVNWNNRDAWTVFSARLTTIRVDTAIAGYDARAIMELVSEPPNAWMATNAMALFAMYDRDSNTLSFSFTTKTNRPVADGDQRFRATLANAGSYMNPTNGIDIRLGVGRGLYRIELCNRQGAGLPVVTNSGAAQGSHLCGEAMNHAYWLVGAMNENTGRGTAYWDRAEALTDMTNLNWGSAIRYDRGASVWLNATNRRASFRVLADQSEIVDKVYLCAAKKGSTSTWRMDVQTNDAAGRPAGTSLVSQTFSVSAVTQGWCEVDLPDFQAIEGQAYHFVVSLYSGSVNSTNYLDIKAIMTNTAGRGVLISTSAVPSWATVTNTEPAFRIAYAGGKSFCQPYATNASSAFASTTRYGQRFYPDRSLKLTNISVVLRRDSTTVNAALAVREWSTKLLLSTSAIASSAMSTTNRTLSFKLYPPVRLNPGTPYYFEVSRSSGTGNLYVNRQDTVGAGSYSWGGTNSCCIYSSNGGTTWVDQVHMDIGFTASGP